MVWRISISKIVVPTVVFLQPYPSTYQPTVATVAR